MKPLAALLLAAATSLPAQKVTADKVINEYVKAMGGAKTLARIQTETVTGNVVNEATGRSGAYSLILKSPDRFYSEIVMEPEREIEAYNGMSGWGMTSADEARTLTGNAEKEAEAWGQFWNCRLADIKKDKLAVQLKENESVRGREAYHLQVKLAPGATRDVYIDTQSHLIVREAAGGPQNKQLDYSDYRPVNGTPVPFQIELHEDGHAYRISVDRAEFNAALDVSVFDFPKPSLAALPDLRSLFLELSRNQKDVEELRRKYTYRVTMESEQADSKAKPDSKTIQEFEVFPISGGGEVWHLMAKNGKPLNGDEKKKEDARFNKAYEERTKEAAKEQARLADPKKQAKQDAEDERDISKILRAERFTNPRRERLHGQPVLAFDFGANPDYKPKSMDERFAQSLAGVLWVDEHAHEIVRIEAHFVDGMKIAGGLLASVDRGSNFVFEQTRVNDEVWLPSYTEIHVAVRVLWRRGKGNVIQRFTDYKKFNAESKMVAIEQH
jgi:hypothetical protein